MMGIKEVFYGLWFKFFNKNVLVLIPQLVVLKMGICETKN